MDVRAPAIQFAPNTVARRTLGIALIAAGMIAGAISAWNYAEVTRALAQIEEQNRSTSEASARVHSADSKQGSLRVAASRVDAINNAIVRLNIPWSELFSAFEADKFGDVALLALLPDARKRTLLVQAEAENPNAMVQFVDRLRAAPLFEEAYLVKHERRDQDVGRPYRFAIEVRWKETP